MSSTSQPKVIVIDGNIAAGKTTWLSLIVAHLEEKGLRVCVVEEPVEEWKASGVLKNFYANPRKYAYLFQSYVFVSRIQAAIKKYEKHGNNVDLYILERSWFTDRLFAEVNYKNQGISELEYQIYQTWADFHQKCAPFQPSGFVYLRCDADTSYHRCLERNRGGESNISLEYLRDLLVVHDRFFEKTVKISEEKTVPCLLCDSTPNFVNDLQVRKELFATFDGFLESL